HRAPVTTRSCSYATSPVTGLVARTCTANVDGLRDARRTPCRARDESTREVTCSPLSSTSARGVTSASRRPCGVLPGPTPGAAPGAALAVGTPSRAEAPRAAPEASRVRRVTGVLRMAELLRSMPGHPGGYGGSGWTSTVSTGSGCL